MVEYIFRCEKCGQEQEVERLTFFGFLTPEMMSQVLFALQEQAERLVLVFPDQCFLCAETVSDNYRLEVGELTPSL